MTLQTTANCRTLLTQMRMCVSAEMSSVQSATQSSCVPCNRVTLRDHALGFLGCFPGHTRSRYHAPSLSSLETRPIFLGHKCFVSYFSPIRFRRIVVLTKPSPSVFFTTGEGRVPCPQALSVSSPHTQVGFLCLSLRRRPGPALAPLGLCTNLG